MDLAVPDNFIGPEHLRHQNIDFEREANELLSILNSATKGNLTSSIHCWYLCTQARLRPNISYKGLSGLFEMYAEDLLKRTILLPLLPLVYLMTIFHLL